MAGSSKDENESQQEVDEEQPFRDEKKDSKDEDDDKKNEPDWAKEPEKEEKKKEVKKEVKKETKKEPEKEADKKEENAKPDVKTPKSKEDQDAEDAWSKAEEKKTKKNTKSSKKEDKSDAWAKAEEEAKQKKEQQDKLDQELHPHRLTIHKLFCGISILMTAAALGMLIGQILSLVYFDLKFIEIVLRVYVIALCGIFVLVEMEITGFAAKSIFLRNWTSRGLLYAFIGVLGLNENESEALRNARNSAKVFAESMAWIMIACGILYFVMGFLCVQGLFIAQREDFAARMADAKARRASVTDGSVRGSVKGSVKEEV